MKDKMKELDEMYEQFASEGGEEELIVGIGAPLFSIPIPTTPEPTHNVCFTVPDLPWKKGGETLN